MEHSLQIYFLLFLIYAILGWIMETTAVSIEKRKFVYRGFLIGPYCPIYGFGAILITLLLNRLEPYPVILFLSAILICGLLEYSTSYIMEKVFRARWWDYSKKKFNINGRICLDTIIPFGILGFLIIYVLNPFMLKQFNLISDNILNVLSIIFFTIIFIDTVISLKVVSNIRSTATKINNGIIKDNTEEITAKVKEILRSKSFFSRRLVNAYPDLKTMLKKKKEEIIEKTLEVKEEITERVFELKEDISDKVEDLKYSITDKVEDISQKVGDVGQDIKEGIKKVRKTKNNKQKEGK